MAKPFLPFNFSNIKTLPELTRFLTIWTRNLILEVGSIAIPVGAYMYFDLEEAPTGWLRCDGTLKLVSQYPALAAKLGTRHGGDGVTTFGLPNGARIVLMGAGGTATSTIGNEVGDTGGAETHTLTTAELATHSHTLSGGTTSSDGAHTHTVGLDNDPGATANRIEQFDSDGGQDGTRATSSDGAHTHTVSGTIGNAGSGDAHNNVQPSLIGLLCIKT